MNYQLCGKKLFDILFASLAIVLLFPILLLVAVLVRLFLGSPVLFSQERPGLYRKPFTIYKFRTMTQSRDHNGILLPDGERLSPFSRFLRSTSLDELPELINVLKGEMSIVGPRPLLMEYLDHYSLEQIRRHDVKPGLTGWAQVNGRNAITWQERFSLDIWYVDNLSFWLDIKIILMTIEVVVSRRGISQSGHATIQKFIGNQREM